MTKRGDCNHPSRLPRFWQNPPQEANPNMMAHGLPVEGMSCRLQIPGSDVYSRQGHGRQRWERFLHINPATIPDMMYAYGICNW